MKHIADHDHGKSGARVQNFIKIARDRSDSIWRVLWQRPSALGAGNRRVLEFVRIGKGRQT